MDTIILAAMTRIFCFTLFAFVAGCAYPNQFRNVQTDSPHAVLIGDGVKLTDINQQPTSFWSTRQRFRVSPGPIVMRVISRDRANVRYDSIQYTAEAGHQYSVQRERANGSDGVSVRNSSEQRVAVAKRESAR